MHKSQFIDYIQFEKRNSAHTIIAYTHDLNEFDDFIQKEFNGPLLDVNYQMIRSWLVHLMEKKLTAKSVNRKLSTLKSFYKFLVKKQMIKVNPATRVASPKIPKRLPSFVEEDKMDMVFKNNPFSDDFTGTRDKLIMELFYSTGMRRSEIINLKISDINSNSVKVLGKGNKERIIPVTNSVLEILKSYLKYRKEMKLKDTSILLLNDKGKIMSPGFVYNKVIYYLGRVTSMKKKSPHIIRHTFATHMLNHGADINAIKELLGHSSLAATQVYTHNSIEKLKNIYTNAHPLAG